MMRFAIGSLILTSLLTPHVQSQGTDLGGGVVTRTDVEHLADLALDIRDIEQYTSTDGSAAVALQIYNDGRNSETQPGLKFRLRELTDLMTADGLARTTPGFLFQLYGLADRSTNLEDLQEYQNAADEYVRSSISSSREHATAAILILKLWMYGTHVLYNGVDICQKMISADNPAQFKLNGGGMDEFIALWIGTGQQASSSEGYSLYALAQRAANEFGTADPEADVNTAIKLLYQEGANILSLEGACSSKSPDSARHLWSVVQSILGQMNIPLMQMLIHSIVEQDPVATELYAMAIVPQLAQCRPSSFKRLKEELLTQSPNFGKTDALIQELQSVYGCLGFTCDEIGELTKSDVDVTCPSDAKDLAEYAPTTDVAGLARIDLDILQMRILSSLESFNFAKYVYQFGRNSPVLKEQTTIAFTSLRDLAVSSKRRDADPIFSAFEEYHNDPNYADTIVKAALNGKPKWGVESIPQRAAIVADVSAFHIVYIYALAEINGAVKECRSTDEDDGFGAIHPWDEVAALLIGSLEGTEEGGSLDPQDGQLSWGLGNQRAFQFQTLNGKAGYAKVNSELEDLLFAGRGELDARDCDNLERTANRIKNLMLVPLLQSTLRYAIQNEQQDTNSEHESLAKGEVFALSIIPIMKTVDPGAADIVDQNMVVRDGIPLVRDGAQMVADALGSYAETIGVGCESIGYTEQADPCKKTGRSGAYRMGSMTGILMGIVGAFFFLF